VFSLGLNNPPRSTVPILYSKSRAAKRYDAANKGTLGVKWRGGGGLDFSLMPHSALKCAPRSAIGLKRLRGLCHSADNL
jgi:hypothetical protein